VNEVIVVLREFGFPILVCMWFMWRMEKKLDGFSEHVNKLVTAVETMAKVVDRFDEGEAE